MAASGSVVGDLIPKSWKLNNSSVVRISQITTLLIGIISILLASVMQNVISLMLYAYAFMVSGLFVPVLAALFLKRRFPQPALFSMITGGGVTLVLILSEWALPWQLDANIFGLSTAVLVYIAMHQLMLRKTRIKHI